MLLSHSPLKHIENFLLFFCQLKVKFILLIEYVFLVTNGLIDFPFCVLAAPATQQIRIMHKNIYTFSASPTECM